jgi:hypothetical protein
MPEPTKLDVQRGMTELGRKRYELFHALRALGYSDAIPRTLNTTEETIDEALTMARDQVRSKK